MSKENNFEKVRDESIEETGEIGGNGETIWDGTEEDNDAGEYAIMTAPSTNNKGENIDGSILEKLRRLTSKKNQGACINGTILHVAY